jgi:hypothetical protein
MYKESMHSLFYIHRDVNLINFLICKFIYMNIYIYIYIYMHKLVRVHVYINIYVYIFFYTYFYSLTPYIGTGTKKHVCHVIDFGLAKRYQVLYMYVYVCIYICVYVYIYMCVYIYI